MHTIQKSIEQLERLDYFTPWKDILLGKKVIHYWESILLKEHDPALCKEFGTYLDLHRIPFVIVIEYIDSFFRYASEYAQNKYAIQDSIAKSYLVRKLEDDSTAIQKELDKKLFGALEKKRELINAHLLWMRAFIASVKGEKCQLQLDPTHCTVGKWLQKNKGNPSFEKINEKHNYLHALAQSALRMYEKNEYAFFLLPYIDIVAYSYAIRDMLLHFYFVEHLDSIYIDPLSGLPNYLQLFHSIETYNGDNKSLFVFNVSEFSNINLVHGHKNGNKIIKEIANYLSNKFNHGLIYRIYADEFAVILPTQGREKVIRELKEGIESYPFQIDTLRISIRLYGSVSKIGPSVLELCEYGLIASKKQHSLMINADTIEKKQIDAFAENISFQQKLRLAFMDKRIKLYYQPIFNLKRNTVETYEVLMRLEDDDGTIHTPNYFLDTLKSMYIYPEVTKLIIQQAFTYFKGKNYAFSLNLTYSDIKNPDIHAFIVTILKSNPNIASQCTFELIESEAILNMEEIHAFIKMVHSYGAKIAIDDFGSGYSNYDLIFNLDIDYIKIDGSLIKNLLNDHKSEIMVGSIVTLAKEKGAKVIAEWVLDQALLQKVKDIGIEYAQGNYIGEATPNLSGDKHRLD